MAENRNRPGDKRRADAVEARRKGVITRDVGTSRGTTTSGSKSTKKGGMKPVGFQSDVPSMGLSRSAISNSSFIPERPLEPTKSISGLPANFVVTPKLAGLNLPGVATEASKVRDEDMPDSGRRPTRPRVRTIGTVKGSTETTSPRGDIHFTGAKTERTKRRMYTKDIAERGLKMNEGERSYANAYSQRARESENIGRSRSRDYMNDYLSDQTGKMRGQLAARKSATSAPKAPVKRKTFGALLGITAAAGAMSKKNR